MGKGSIISHDGDGLYTVTVRYDTSGISTAISTLEGIIAELETIISDPESTQRETLFAKLRKMSAQKRIDYLQGKTPSDETVSAWCADLTTDLAGEVGTIEIARNKNKGLLIQPGYEGNAAYNQTRDGQLVPTMAMPPVNNFVNLGFLPGLQKWAPGYRTGTITDIDYTADTCDVSLDSAKSSQQSLDINKLSSLAGVPVEYMSCNAAAFETGDNVVVNFQNYDWDQPRVIGFQDNPQPCAMPLQFTLNGEAITKPIQIYLLTSDGSEMTGPFVTDATGFLAADDIEVPPGSDFTELYAAVYYVSYYPGSVDPDYEILFDFWKEDITAASFNFFMVKDTETSSNGSWSTERTLTTLCLKSVDEGASTDDPRKVGDGVWLDRVDKKWADAKIGTYPETEINGTMAFDINISGLKLTKIDRYRFPLDVVNDYIRNCNPGSQPVEPRTLSSIESTNREEYVAPGILPTGSYEYYTMTYGRMYSVPALLGYTTCVDVFTDGAYGGPYYYECDLAWRVENFWFGTEEINLCSDCTDTEYEVVSTGFWKRTADLDSHTDPRDYFILTDERGSINSEPDKNVYINETRFLYTRCVNKDGEHPSDCPDRDSFVKCGEDMGYGGDFDFNGNQYDHIYAINKTGF